MNNRNYELVSDSDLSIEEQIKAIQRVLCKNNNYPEVVKQVPKVNVPFSIKEAFKEDEE